MGGPQALALAGVHHVKLPATDLARSREWYQSRLGVPGPDRVRRAGKLMSYGLARPNGGPVLGLRLDPERARPA